MTLAPPLSRSRDRGHLGERLKKKIILFYFFAVFEKKREEEEREEEAGKDTGED